MAVASPFPEPAARNSTASCSRRSRSGSGTKRLPSPAGTRSPAAWRSVAWPGWCRPSPARACTHPRGDARAGDTRWPGTRCALGTPSRSSPSDLVQPPAAAASHTPWSAMRSYRSVLGSVNPMNDRRKRSGGRAARAASSTADARSPRAPRARAATRCRSAARARDASSGSRRRELAVERGTAFRFEPPTQRARALAGHRRHRREPRQQRPQVEAAAADHDRHPARAPGSRRSPRSPGARTPPPRTARADPDTGAKATMARPEGTIAMPAATSVSPNPLASAGCCSCWVVISMLAIKAKPTRIEAMLVSRMGGAPTYVDRPAAG